MAALVMDESAPTVMVRLVAAPAPLLFAALTVTAETPARVGVPLITPVFGFKLRPGGSAPLLVPSANVVAVLSELLAVTVKLKG